MGRTLFWYVFKDLLKIFLMAAGALSGIMSFGGLLKPLTQQGLDGGQVTRVMAYIGPAMLAYALPIAALFAATVVYGRLSADNELTACRAGGVSLGPALGMAFPGLVFGLLVATLSLVFLWFVVPRSILSVERVITSNVAKIIANKIERTHELDFDKSMNVFADRAYLPPIDPARPDRQLVVLEGVTIVQYEKAGGTTEAPTVAARGPDGKPAKPTGTAVAEKEGLMSGDAVAETSRGKFSKVPKEFLMASSATVDITSPSNEDDDPIINVSLEGGTRFLREFRGGTQAGIEAVQFGPIAYESPIKEDTKFMDGGKLGELSRNPERSRKMAKAVEGYLRRDQVRAYIADLVRKLGPPPRTLPIFGEMFRYPEELARNAGLLASPGQSTVSRFVRFQGTNGSKIVLVLDPSAPPPTTSPDGEELILDGRVQGSVSFERTDPPPAGSPPGTRQETSFQSARELRIRVRPDQAIKRLNVTVDLLDRSPGGASTRAVSGNYSSTIEVAMPPEVSRLAQRKVADYLGGATLTKDQKSALRREKVVLENNIEAERNGRMSFSVSCLILVMVGTCLGMMFKSGNFLTAFAVSFVPALICITLIVAGQQTCHAVPVKIDSKPNPLGMGLLFIWSGNAANLLLATGLLWKLQKQ